MPRVIQKSRPSPDEARGKARVGVGEKSWVVVPCLPAASVLAWPTNLAKTQAAVSRPAASRPPSSRVRHCVLASRKRPDDTRGYLWRPVAISDSPLLVPLYFSGLWNADRPPGILRVSL